MFFSNFMHRWCKLLSPTLLFISLGTAQLYDYNAAEDTLLSFTTTTDIVYGVGAINHGADTMDLLLDSYVPYGMSGSKKAAIVTIHGGGFTSGTKNRMLLHSEHFAKRGFVCFSINYRLAGQNPPVYDTNGTVDRRKAAVIDGKTALRWVYANATTYHIDTNNIFLLGSSAGAIMALHMAVLDAEAWVLDDENKEMDPRNHPGVSSTVQGAISLSGSLYENVSELDSDDPALMVFHGAEDALVSFQGAEEIYNRSTQISHSLEYYPLQGAGHVPSNVLVDGKSFLELSFDFLLKYMNQGPTTSIIHKQPHKPNGITLRLVSGAIQIKISNNQQELFNISGKRVSLMP
jgi:predicted esterase